MFFFKRIKTPGIAHNAYIIGQNGMAAVVDPRRDIGEYLEVARSHDLTLRYAIETHRQEDFVLGSAALREVTGAEIVSGDHDLFGQTNRMLKDKEELDLQGLRFRALATPGHTPESTSYAVFIPESLERAWGVFTGDALFIGETGRTDLSDPHVTAENAGLLYDKIREKIFSLGDQTLLFPAHGSGSVCGGNIASRDESTLGLEKEYNPVWRMSRAEFVAHKRRERIPRPPYFSLMERMNLGGGPGNQVSARSVRVLQPKAFDTECRQGLVVDTRLPEAFAGGHIPRSYSIWMRGLPVFGGWVADDQNSLFLVLENASELETAVASLTRIGIDCIAGLLAGGFEAWRDAGLPIETSGTIPPAELARDLAGYRILDVREISEYEAGHIKGALSIYVGDLEERLDDFARHVGRDEPIVVTCSVGHRASLGVSILKRHGFERVYNLLGGMNAWSAIGCQTRHGTKGAKPWEE